MSDETDNVRREENPVRSLATQPVVSGGLVNSEKAKRFFTTLDLKTQEGKKLFLRMKKSAELTSDDMLNKQFTIVNAIAHEVDIVQQATGEVASCIRIVLLMDDGRTVAFVSQGVWSTLLDVISVYGQPPWSPPIACKLVKRKTRGGFSVLLLEVD